MFKLEAEFFDKEQTYFDDYIEPTKLVYINPKLLCHSNIAEYNSELQKKYGNLFFDLP